MQIKNGIVQGTLRVFNKLISKKIDAETIAENGVLIADKYRSGVRKNLLDNSRFKVNQRGQATYSLSNSSSSTYCVDRWFKAGDTGTMTVEVISDGVTISNTSSSNDVLFRQKLREDAVNAYSEVRTYSILTTDGRLFTKTFNTSTGGYISLGSDVGTSTVAETQVLFYLYGGVSISIKAVKLEIGEGQTLAYKDADGNWVLYDDYDYNVDLLECQRYLAPIGFATMYFHLVATSTTRASLCIPLTIKMVSTPTVFGTFKFQQQGSTSAPANVYPVVKYMGDHYIQLEFSGGYNTSSPYNLTVVQGYLSAEL